MHRTSVGSIATFVSWLLLVVLGGCAGSPDDSDFWQWAADRIASRGSGSGGGGGGAPEVPVPRIAMDGHGAGMAVWADGGVIHARRFVADAGWEPEEIIATGGGENVSVAMFGVGDAVAIFKRGQRVLALRYSPVAGWDAQPTVLDESVRGVLDPRVATSPVAGRGVVFAVWRKVVVAADGFTTYSAAMADRYVVDHWEGARRIDPASEVPVFSLHPAAGALSALAVWSTSVRFDRNVFGARWSGAGWDAPRLLGTSTTSAQQPNAAVDGAEDAFVVWEQEGDVHRASYDAASRTWATSAPLNVTPPATRGPDVVLNADGRGIAAWSTATNAVFAQIVPDPTGLPERIDVDASGPIGTDGVPVGPRPGVDALGNARVAWGRASGGVYAARYDAGGRVWEAAESLDRLGRNPDLAMDASGRAIAVWWSNGFHERVWEPAEGEILFATDRDTDLEVFSMRPDGFAPTRRTDHDAADDDPVWSPDRSRIAFLSDRDGQPEGDRDLYVKSASSLPATRLTNFGADGGRALDPSWEPAGRRIAVAWSFGSGSAAFGGIALVDADTGAQEDLEYTQAGDRWPTWSGDGTRLAFVRGGAIMVLDLQPAGQAPVEVLGAAAGAEATAWSPVDDRIAYAAPGATDKGIHVLDLGTGVTTRLTTLGDDAPAWSPDGRRLAFVRITGFGWRIFRMADTGGAPAEIPGQHGSSFDPDWK